jgi:hypothetical protein
VFVCVLASYYRLVFISFALQNALDKSQAEAEDSDASSVDVGDFYVQCFESASNCVSIARDGLGSSGELRYATDSVHVFTAYGN